VLTKIFEPKYHEVIGGWRKLNNEDLQNFFSSRNIIRMTQSRRMCWAGHVAFVRENRMHTGLLWEGQMESDH
jgi:hypothetical protein